MFENKCKENLKNKSRIRTNVCDSIEHKWQSIKESIVKTTEELLLREKLAPKRE